MQEKFCDTCAYYRQHYTFHQHKIFQVYCGHCTYSRPKTKRPDAKACEHHIYAEPQDSAFATKEYLSKAVLEYVLKLDLLPEIYKTEE